MLTAALLLLSLLTLSAETDGIGGSCDYFPEHLFHQDQEWDSAAAQTIAEYLEAVEEPPLSPGSEGEVYRLTWLPNFDPGIVVRLTSSQQERARIVRFSSLSPEAGADVRSATLSPPEWNALVAAVEQTGFWEEMENEPLPSGQVVLDGSRWVLEGVRDGQYKAVQRIFPRPDRQGDSGFLKLSLTILHVSGVDIEEGDLY